MSNETSRILRPLTKIMKKCLPKQEFELFKEYTEDAEFVKGEYKNFLDELGGKDNEIFELQKEVSGLRQLGYRADDLTIREKQFNEEILSIKLEEALARNELVESFFNKFFGHSSIITINTRNTMSEDDLISAAAEIGAKP